MSGNNVYDTQELPFSLFDAAVQRGQPSETAMDRSTHLQSSCLSRRFFSQANVDRLQGALREAVRDKTGYVIDRQSDEQMLIVMRYVFMQSSRHEGGDREIARLNALVLREIAPQVASGLLQYLAYLKDASTVYTPIPRGEATSVKGTRTAQLFRAL